MMSEEDRLQRTIQLENLMIESLQHEAVTLTPDEADALQWLLELQKEHFQQLEYIEWEAGLTGPPFPDGGEEEDLVIDPEIADEYFRQEVEYLANLSDKELAEKLYHPVMEQGAIDESLQRSLQDLGIDTNAIMQEIQSPDFKQNHQEFIQEYEANANPANWKSQEQAPTHKELDYDR